ncbi:Six-hairpin glycosidase [Polyplosphaeria fusca]|uniref:Six-hairpin glycosidase n=1 Tax=Polyplosphaeria fusca TaxID=682080 RepID=A0A9P4UUP9_9PLEO|nr:Six-hairpin glycosidase [Polyplosphaeria fusca]
MVSSSIISLVLQKAIQVATHSWEYGTVSQAQLEWQNASLSIWNDPFPKRKVPTLDWRKVPALTYLEPHIRLDNTTLIDGDGAAGDPASLGIAALMIGKSDERYFDAATRQEQHLIHDVPRWENGAISHRETYKELWADFVYMVPPFLAYYAVASGDLGLAKEAAHQVKLYRDVLVTGEGPWLHIVGPGVPDFAMWSTGNGWAAAGASRVLATLRKSKFDGETKEEQAQLTSIVKGIIDGAIKFDVDQSGLLRNYLNESSWWGEISGTSILAATAFRMARLEPDSFGKKYTKWATKKMELVDSKIDKSTGIVAPAIDPLNWHNETKYVNGSPEGQSFVVLLHAANRDWKASI